MFLFTCLFVCLCLAQAGTVKVLKTTPVRYEMGLEGMALIVNVQLQIENVTSHECSCIVFLHDEAWPAMNLRQLAKFCEEEAYVGETPLDPVPRTATKVIEVRIPIELSYFDSKSEQAYIQAYVVDMEEKAMITTGPQVHFPLRDKTLTTSMGKNLAKEMEQQMGAAILGGLIEGLLGGGSGFAGRGEDSVTCSHCHGGGRCYRCYGSPDESKGCDVCHGSGKCPVCKGAGYY